MKKPAPAMTIEDIEHNGYLLKENLCDPPTWAIEILERFETECKRVLALVNGVPLKEIRALSDANDVFWLASAYPIRANAAGKWIHVEVDLFTYAADALTAVYSLKGALERGEKDADGSYTWAQEEAESLLNKLKMMRFHEAEGRTAKREWAGVGAGKQSVKARQASSAERNKTIVKRARELLASGAATTRSISAKLAGKYQLTSPTVRTILREEGVLSPAPKRRK